MSLLRALISTHYNIREAYPSVHYLNPQPTTTSSPYFSGYSSAYGEMHPVSDRFFRHFYYLYRRNPLNGIP